MQRVRHGFYKDICGPRWEKALLGYLAGCQKHVGRWTPSPERCKCGAAVLVSGTTDDIHEK